MLAGAGTVVNAVGPYHQTALGVIEAAIDAGVDYVDMNDDHEVAEAVLLDPSWDSGPGHAGVTVLIDCGVVPGLSGMLVRHAAGQLDQTERVAVRFAWNYNREYPAAIQHFLRINSGQGLQYLDGRHVRKPPLDGREDVDFQQPVGRIGVYFTGVPDPVAIARFIPGVREATAKGTFYQPDANRLVEDMVRWGFTAYDPPSPGRRARWSTCSATSDPRRGSPTSTSPATTCRSPFGWRSREAAQVLRTLGYEAHDHSRRATTTFTALAALAVAKGELAPGCSRPRHGRTQRRFCAHSSRIATSASPSGAIKSPRGQWCSPMPNDGSVAGTLARVRTCVRDKWVPRMPAFGGR